MVLASQRWHFERMGGYSDRKVPQGTSYDASAIYWALLVHLLIIQHEFV